MKITIFSITCSRCTMKSVVYLLRQRKTWMKYLVWPVNIQLKYLKRTCWLLFS
uniref:Uncharacterized protein n=1 Tax=Arundo donax TaxID=35708 RepID=A0A0A9AVD7_ARUDO